jgi:hypothetical protein
METYLKTRVGVLTGRVTGSRIGRRHCKVRRGGEVKGEGMGRKAKTAQHHQL